MPAAPTRRHYPRRDPVALAAFGSASEGAAHQKALKVERQYLDLVAARVRAGQRELLLRMRIRVAALERQLVPTAADVQAELRDVHHADQVGDTARFALALDGLTPAAEERLLRAAVVEIAQLTDLCQALEARKAGR